MIPWTLTGTARQQEIVRGAFEQIKFPFDRLTLPGSPELGWRDLNGGEFRSHQDEHHEGDKPEPLMGRMGEQRNYILGVFYPGSARIYLDNALVDYPEIAQATVSAEIAHAVDEFLPLSDAQRDTIMSLLHGDFPDEHSWWEKVDYSAEYYSLVGETFMILFTKAYSDIPFGNAEDFVHSGANVTPECIRQVIGIERTDSFIRCGSSKVYHRPEHHLHCKSPAPISDTTGLRPCKVCKP